MSNRHKKRDVSGEAEGVSPLYPLQFIRDDVPFCAQFAQIPLRGSKLILEHAVFRPHGFKFSQPLPKRRNRSEYVSCCSP